MSFTRADFVSLFKFHYQIDELVVNKLAVVQYVLLERYKSRSSDLNIYNLT